MGIPGQLVLFQVQAIVLFASKKQTNISSFLARVLAPPAGWTDHVVHL